MVIHDKGEETPKGMAVLRSTHHDDRKTGFNGAVGCGRAAHRSLGTCCRTPVGYIGAREGPETHICVTCFL